MTEGGTPILKLAQVFLGLSIANMLCLLLQVIHFNSTSEHAYCYLAARPICTALPLMA